MNAVAENFVEHRKPKALDSIKYIFLKKETKKALQRKAKEKSLTK